MISNKSTNIVNWLDNVPRWLRYTVAVTLPFLALFLTLTLWSVISPIPSALFFGAIALASWMGGFAPGLASVITSIILMDYFLLSGNRTILNPPSDFITLSIFGLVATVISWTGNQRRSANFELRTSRDELDAIINSVSDGITVQDNTGKVWFANAAAARITGYGTPSKVTSASVSSMHQRFQMFDDHDQPMSISQLPRTKVFAQGRDMKMEFKVRDTELSTERWLEVNTAPIFDPRGNVRLVVNVIRDITGAKEMENTIRYERRRVQSILDELQVFVGLLDMEGKIVEVNRSATRTAGLEAPDLIGTAMYDTYAWSKTTEIQDRIKDSIVRAAAGESSQFDIEARAIGDISIFVEYTIAPIRNSVGDIEFLIASAINITERKQNEIEMAQLADLLEKERERLARIVNTLPGVVFEGVSPSETSQGGIIFMSNYTETLLGYLPNNWIDNPNFGSTIIHPDDLESLVTNLTGTYECGENGYFECRIFAADGRTVFVEIRTTPYRDDDGQVTGLVGTMIDITERKKREVEISQLASSLELERERLKRIVNTLPGIVFEAVGTPRNGDQKMVFVSDYAETLLGYPPSSWIDDPTFGGSIVHPDDVAAIMEDATVIYESGEQGILNYRVYATDQRIVHIEARSIPYRNFEGDMSGVVGVMMDITKRKDTEDRLMHYAKELRRSNAELEQFAYVASHDLQEPLRMVGSYLQLIEHRYNNRLDKDGHEFIAYAVDGANRMKKLIQDLLSYSRVQRGREAFRICPMETTLDITKRNLSMSIQEAHAIITSESLPSVYGNEQQISQLLQNLLGNAIKFHGEAPPEIHIGVEEYEENWEFSVRDNGIGIEEQYLERIFVIFQRLHSRDTYAGTGIGLALCRKIVGQHGGRIWAESKINEGSTFRFTIAKPDILMKEKNFDSFN